MKTNEKPILFSAPMVRAILADTKTQTRRVVNVDHLEKQRGTLSIDGWQKGDIEVAEWRDLAKHWNPYGQPGEHLWVRETWRTEVHTGEWKKIGYRATDTNEACQPATNMPEFERLWEKHQDHWRPSIFMPRWASRITLEIVSVRIERLQDISADDARAEGMRDDMIHLTGNGRAIMARKYDVYNGDRPSRDEIAIAHYRGIWESINGHGSWEKNPWVWVIEFRKMN